MTIKAAPKYCYNCLQFYGAQQRLHRLTDELLNQEVKLSKMAKVNTEYRDVLTKVKLLMEGAPAIAPMTDQLILELVKDTLRKY